MLGYYYCYYYYYVLTVMLILLLLLLSLRLLLFGIIAHNVDRALPLIFTEWIRKSVAERASVHLAAGADRELRVHVRGLI